MIDIGNLENVTGRNADNRHCDTVESESIPAVLVYCVKRERYNVILGPHLGRLRHRNSLCQAESHKDYLHT